MSDLQTVLRLLPGLTADELGRVRSAIGSLGALGPAPGARVGGDASWLLSVVCDVFPDQPVPVAMLRRSRQYPTFAAKLPDVMTWLRGACERRVEQQALARAALTLMRRDLALSGHVTVSPALVMSNIHTLPATLDRHFPGYAEAGLLGLVLKQQRYDD